MTPTAFHVPGDAELTYSATLYSSATATRHGVLFVFAHGAGAGQSHPFMTRYARGLAERGLDVVTFNFPYMEAGRRSPDRVPVLEDAFRRVVVAAVHHRHVDARRLLVGGKSMGGRIATHLAAAPDAWPADAPSLDGVVVFGYPLNPPGGSRRSQDRVSHLLKIAVPTMTIQGTRDTFGAPADIEKALAAQGGQPAITVHAVTGGDHSLSVPKSLGRTQAEVDDEVCNAVVDWIRANEGRRAKS